MACEVVAYTPDLAPQVAAVQCHLWSEDPALNAAYLEWKYRENPYLDGSLIRLALSEGQVVAMRGMFGAMWQSDGSAGHHLLPCADDFVVAPSHRNRGVASQVMKATIEAAARHGFPFALSLSAGSVTFVNSLAQGWRSAGSYQPAWHGRISNPFLRRLRDLARRMPWVERFKGALDVLTARRLFEGDRSDASPTAGRVSFSTDPRPMEMAALVARSAWDGRIRHVRDASYLAWRFRNPRNAYRFLYRDDGGLQGYLVLQRRVVGRGDRGIVSIADWEAADELTRRDLLRAALQRSRYARIQAWTVSLDEAGRALLRDHGFVTEESNSRGSRKGLLVRRLQDAEPTARWSLGSRDLSSIADWDLRMLYSMAA
jgi:GNAT superfamily N-acetyltransferase